MQFIRWPTSLKSLRGNLVLYTAMAGLAALVMGCSPGPVSKEEAEELRSEIKEMREELIKVRSELAGVIESTADSELEKQVQDIRNKLELMARSLSDVEEQLKPKEPPKPAGQAPGGPPPGGTAPGGPPPR